MEEKYIKLFGTIIPTVFVVAGVLIILYALLFMGAPVNDRPPVEVIEVTEPIKEEEVKPEPKPKSEPEPLPQRTLYDSKVMFFNNSAEDTELFVKNKKLGDISAYDYLEFTLKNKEYIFVLKNKSGEEVYSTNVRIRKGYRTIITPNAKSKKFNYKVVPISYTSNSNSLKIKVIFEAIFLLIYFSIIERIGSKKWKY